VTRPAPAGRRWRGAGPRSAARRLSGDDGQVTLLTIAFATLALLLVTAVVSASQVHLERKHLLALADALALEAADAVDEARLYDGGVARPAEPGRPGGRGSDATLVRPADVRAAVDGYLAAHPSSVGRLEDVTVLEATSDDGRTVRVRLGARVRPALASVVTAPWSGGITLEVESSARAW